MYKRKDDNQDEVIAAFERLGCSVRSVHAIPGALDLIVGVCGIDQRVEVKDGAKPPSKQKLTPAEKKEIARWKGRKPVIITSIDDVVALVTKLRHEAS